MCKKIPIKNMPPVSRNLQCGITLYSNVKNVTRIRNWDKGHGIHVVLFLLLIFYYYYHYYNYYYYRLKLSLMIFCCFHFWYITECFAPKVKKLVKDSFNLIIIIIINRSRVPGPSSEFVLRFVLLLYRVISHCKWRLTGGIFLIGIS